MNFDDQDIHYFIYLVLEPVDMRLGMDGLSAKVQLQLQTNPCEGHIFVFKNKRGNRIKVLKWDATGVWLAQRRLHEGSFVWPSPGLINSTLDRGVYQMSAQSWNYLIKGVNWMRMQTSMVDIKHWKVA
jgi:transposase